MAINNIYMLYVILLIFFVSGSGATLVDDVCGLSHYRPFCLKVLGSRSGPGTDAIKLAQIVINLGLDIAVSTKYKAHYLWQTENNPVLKNHLARCEALYTDAVGNMRDAAGNLNGGGAYGQLVVNGGETYRDAQECDHGFGTVWPPLSDENYKSMRFSEMLIIVGQMLSGKQTGSDDIIIV